VSLDEPYFQSIRDLNSVFEEAAEPGWDGYGGSPVSSVTLARALVLLESLPSFFPKPNISAFPSGEIAFQWQLGPQRMLVIAVNEAGRLTYAALTGHGDLHGTRYLAGDTLPREITDAYRSAAFPGTRYWVR